MQTSMELKVNLSDKQQIKKTWAFATDNRRFSEKRRQLSNFSSCVITACSKEAKRLGIQAGMTYAQAKAMIPELRIMVIGGGHA